MTPARRTARSAEASFGAPARPPQDRSATIASCKDDGHRADRAQREASSARRRGPPSGPVTHDRILKDHGRQTGREQREPSFGAPARASAQNGPPLNVARRGGPRAAPTLGR